MAAGEDAGGQTDMRRRSVCCTRSIPFPYILENKVDSAEGKRGVFFLRTNEGKWSLCVNREERRGDRTRGEFRSNREEGGERDSREGREELICHHFSLFSISGKNNGTNGEGKERGIFCRSFFRFESWKWRGEWKGKLGESYFYAGGLKLTHFFSGEGFSLDHG